MPKTKTVRNPHFHSEDAARKFLESVRWDKSRTCPHCQHGESFALKGETCRPGLYKCSGCRKQFTVTVGTIFEHSHVPLHKWLFATHLLCASKKGCSSKQLERMLHVTYKTAWFMAHRIRESMKDPVFATQLGGSGKTVEADETFFGNRRKQPKGHTGPHHMQKVFSLVERGGSVRSFHVNTVGAKTLRPIMSEQIAQDTLVITDGSNAYHFVGSVFDGHEVIEHETKQYARGPIHVNTLESYFSILKRGLSGIYQHVGAQHLRRYVGEFDFRFNSRHVSDEERTITGPERNRWQAPDLQGHHAQGSVDPMPKKKRTARADDAIPDVSGRSFEDIIGALMKVKPKAKAKPKKRVTKKTAKKVEP